MPQCTTCADPLSRLHACLHCVYIGCWRKDHLKDHQKEKKHTFGKNKVVFSMVHSFLNGYKKIAMDFDRHSLFCYECKDYIYDTELDEKVIRSELISSKKKNNNKH